MARKTLGYVELEWTCSRCGSRNRGSSKTCASCGGAQPAKVAFHRAADEELLTDEAETARAKAEPDVHCAFCGTRNAAGAEKCTQCGADLSTAAARQSGRVLGAFRRGRASPVKCPSCGTPNPAGAHKCSQCNAGLPRTERSKTPKPRRQSRPRKPIARARKPKRRKLKLNQIILAIVILVGVGFLYESLDDRIPTQRVTGVVRDIWWSRSIKIEEQHNVSDEGWRNKIPSGARLGRCTKKLHHTQDNPAPGATEICGTPYVIDKGTGYGEVVQDCEYEVYADWCAYTMRKWVTVDTASLNGTDLDPRWPSLDLRAGQRQGARKETYQVRFDTGERTVTYRTDDRDALERFQIGSKWLLHVNSSGRATPIEPAQ